MRQCFIHIGTHKTGTTSLQILFNQNSAFLAAHDYLYPATGRPAEAPDGHHNIAWEISGDRRFRAEHGTIEDLLNEIDRSSSNVLLSSEDFECSAHHAHRFGSFVIALQKRRLDVVLVLYLRNQLDYSQSLYQTMLKFGIVDSFEEFLETIIERGEYRWQDWIFPFCYRTFADRLERLHGTKLMIRSFEHPATGTVGGDFVRVLELGPSRLGVNWELRAYPRPPLVECARFFHQNRKGTALTAVEAQIISALYEPLSAKRTGISHRSRRKLADRFRESNAYIFAQYGIPEWPSMRPAAAVDDDDIVRLEDLFSSEREQAIRTLSQLFHSPERLQVQR